MILLNIRNIWLHENPPPSHQSGVIFENKLRHSYDACDIPDSVCE